ncbi:MAG: ABC transporter ATP-binding protein [bacterium]
MSDSEPIIRAAGLARRYGSGSKGVEALRGIDLTVSPGEVFGFLGPNGAGKTTSIRILTGQLTPSAGAADVAGCDVVRQRRELHRRIGVVFDTPNLYDQLTGRQNLAFFADLYRADRGRIDALLDQVGLADAADRRFKTYSKGMKQRLILARALLPDPQVLFLDEPTAGLDPASARRVREMIAEAQGRGTTVFLTTHQMELADQVCDRLAILYEGRIVAEDTPRALKHAHAAPLLVIRRDGHEPEKLSLSDPDTPERTAALLRGGDVLEVATEEVTLEDVFLRLTGSALQ